MSEMMDDPFATTVDEENPFATADDFQGGGGAWNPRPSKADDLAEKLIVIVPRLFEKEAKVSEYLQREYGLGETREQWTVDLVVLDGPSPWTFEYRGKKDRDSDEYVTKEHTVEAFPYMMPNFRITWANVMGAIAKIDNGKKPMGVGRIRAGYTAAEMRKGKTFEEFAKEYAAWETAVREVGVKKAGNEPKARWHFEPYDVATRSAESQKRDLDLAMAWWKEARAAGFQI